MSGRTFAPLCRLRSRANKYCCKHAYSPGMKSAREKYGYIGAGLFPFLSSSTASGFAHPLLLSLSPSRSLFAYTQRAKQRAGISGDIGDRIASETRKGLGEGNRKRREYGGGTRVRERKNKSSARAYRAGKAGRQWIESRDKGSSRRFAVIVR